MRIKNKGFTLFELMVTVAIIGILGAVAVPAYQDYTIRSQVTEGLSLASGAKVAVAEYYANHGRYPESMDDIGMVSSQGSYIQETRLDADGTITAVFGNDANNLIHNHSISLVPDENAYGNLEWECEGSMEDKYLPNNCVRGMYYDAQKRRNIWPSGLEQNVISNTLYLSATQIEKYGQERTFYSMYHGLQTTLQNAVNNYNAQLLLSGSRDENGNLRADIWGNPYSKSNANYNLAALQANQVRFMNENGGKLPKDFPDFLKIKPFVGPDYDGSDAKIYDYRDLMN